MERGDEVIMAGFASAGPPKDGLVKITSFAPAGLLESLPLPWLPPDWHRGNQPALSHWWRQLHYVFDLPDPRLFAPFAHSLVSADRQVLERFVAQTVDIASSQAMNTSELGIKIDFDDQTNLPSIASAVLPPRDALAGFAVFLRQCLSPKDRANVEAVWGIIGRAIRDQRDSESEARRAMLVAWRGALLALREASIEQLVRDRMVAEEGWKVFDYREQATPRQLFEQLQYGDLIHWGDRRGEVIAESDDEVESLRQKMNYLEAAVGIAYVLRGFGLLAEAAVTARTEILVPG